jgi:hypothetical protein
LLYTLPVLLSRANRQRILENSTKKKRKKAPLRGKSPPKKRMYWGSNQANRQKRQNKDQDWAARSK